MQILEDAIAETGFGVAARGGVEKVGVSTVDPISG